MKIIGYVFSRKGNKEYSIIQQGFSHGVIEHKTYTYLKSLIEKKIKNEGERKWTYISRLNITAK